VAGWRAGLAQACQGGARLTLRGTRPPEGEQRGGQLQPGPRGLDRRAAAGEQIDRVLEAAAGPFVVPGSGGEEPFQEPHGRAHRLR
jgi:hypothetical protein